MTESGDVNGFVKCLNPNCNKPAKYRGLCEYEYQLACRLVRQKKTTWVELTKNGKIKTDSRKSASEQWLLNKS